MLGDEEHIYKFKKNINTTSTSILRQKLFKLSNLGNLATKTMPQYIAVQSEKWNNRRAITKLCQLRI